MSLSPADAGKHVGLTKQSVMKAIRSGRLSATRDAKGEWQIEPVELFRVWPAVNQDTGKVAPEVYAGNHPVADDIVAILKAQLDDIRADRDHWREAAEHQMAVADQERAERVALSERLLLTDQRPAPERVPETRASTPTDIDPGNYAPEAPRSLWSRLLGRS